MSKKNSNQQPITGYKEVLDNLPEPTEMSDNKKEQQEEALDAPFVSEHVITVKEQQSEKKEITKAIVLEDFSVHLPMPGQYQWNKAFCTLNFRKADVVTDKYHLEFLQKTSKPVRYE